MSARPMELPVPPACPDDAVRAAAARIHAAERGAGGAELVLPALLAELRPGDGIAVAARAERLDALGVGRPGVGDRSLAAGVTALGSFADLRPAAAAEASIAVAAGFALEARWAGSGAIAGCVLADGDDGRSEAGMRAVEAQRLPVVFVGEVARGGATRPGAGAIATLSSLRAALREAADAARVGRVPRRVRCDAAALGWTGQSWLCDVTIPK